MTQLPVISCWRDAETLDATLLLVTLRGAGLGGNVSFTSEVIPTNRGTGSSLAIQKISRLAPGGDVTFFSDPWVAYYDLESRSVNVAHRQDSVWVIEQVDTEIDHVAATGIGLAIGTEGKPRVCYSSTRGVTFAARSEATLKPAASAANGGPANEIHCWERDTLAGLHWERQVVDGGRATLGYEIGVTPPPAADGSTTPVIASSQDGDSLKIVYQPEAGPSLGAVFITFGKDIPNIAVRRQLESADITAYSSLIVEMRGDPGKPVQVGIKDRSQDDNGLEAKVALTLSGDWTTYTIPLTKFSGAKLEQIYFMAEFVFGGAVPVTAFVRSVKFSDVVVTDTVVNRIEPPVASTPSIREFVKGSGPVAGFDSDIGSAPPLPPERARFTRPDDASSAFRIDFPEGPTSAFVTVRPQTAPNVDVTGFQTLLIEMRADAPVGTVHVGIKDVSQRTRDDEVRVPVPLTTDWRTYAFPLGLFRRSATAPNLSQLFVVAELVHETAAPLSVFVRSVRYSSEPATTAAPLNAAVLGGSAVVHTSLALDSKNRPFIPYFDLDAGKLHVASRVEQIVVGPGGNMQPVSRWQVVAIPDSAGDSFAGEFTSAKVDDEGSVHIGYWTINGPRYARLSGSGPAVTEGVENTVGAGMYVSLDLGRSDGTQEPEVAYYDAASGGRLKFARRQDGHWVAPQIVDSNGNVGGFASLKLDAQGRRIIAYYDFDGGVIRIATLTA